MTCFDFMWGLCCKQEASTINVRGLNRSLAYTIFLGTHVFLFTFFLISKAVFIFSGLSRDLMQLWELVEVGKTGAMWPMGPMATPRYFVSPREIIMNCISALPMYMKNTGPEPVAPATRVVWARGSGSHRFYHAGSWLIDMYAKTSSNWVKTNNFIIK